MASCGLRGDGALAHAHQHQRGLLIRALDRNEPHRRAAHRLGIGRVILAAFDIGLHQLRRDQLNVMSELRQQPGPVIRSTAGFDRNHGRWAMRKEVQHLLAAHLLAQYRLLGGVGAMQLKDVL